MASMIHRLDVQALGPRKILAARLSIELVAALTFMRCEKSTWQRCCATQINYEEGDLDLMANLIHDDGRRIFGQC